MKLGYLIANYLVITMLIFLFSPEISALTDKDVSSYRFYVSKWDATDYVKELMQPGTKKEYRIEVRYVAGTIQKTSQHYEGDGWIDGGADVTVEDKNLKSKKIICDLGAIQNLDVFIGEKGTVFWAATSASALHFDISGAMMSYCREKARLWVQNKKEPGFTGFEVELMEHGWFENTIGKFFFFEFNNEYFKIFEYDAVSSLTGDAPVLNIKDEIKEDGVTHTTVSINVTMGAYRNETTEAGNSYIHWLTSDCEKPTDTVNSKELSGAGIGCIIPEDKGGTCGGHCHHGN